MGCLNFRLARQSAKPIWALIFGGMMPLGGIESGFLSHAVGVPWTIAVGAIICAGAGLVTWWAVRRNPTASN